MCGANLGNCIMHACKAVVKAFSGGSGVAR